MNSPFLAGTIKLQKFEPRDDQKAILQEVFRLFNAGYLRLLVQCPTGFGKTILFGFAILEFVQKLEPVLVLVHREELLFQAKEKIEAICGCSVGVIKSGHPEDRSALIQVASVQTVCRRELWFTPSLIVTDEGHHAVADSYLSVYKRFPEAYQLIVTATPSRPDGKPLKEVADVLIQGPSVKELIQKGHLCGYRLFAPAAQIDTKGVKTTAGDYNAAQLRSAAMTAAIMGAIVPTWKQYALDKQTVVFCVDVEHSKQVCKLYQDAGIKAEHLDGDTPTDDRRRILAEFAAGEITVLCNCGIISEGLDIVGIHCVQILRPTKSLPLYLQQIGRSLRTAPGKEHAIIIDHTTNWLTHGLPDDDREWSLEGRVKRQVNQLQKAEDGEVTVAPEPREISFDGSVQLAEVVPTDELPTLSHVLERLLETQKARGYKAAWVAFKFLEARPGLADLKECAKKLGYKPGWAWHQFQKLQAEGGIA